MVIVTSTDKTKCNTGKIPAINLLEQSIACGIMQVLGFETTVTFPSKFISFSAENSVKNIVVLFWFGFLL